MALRVFISSTWSDLQPERHAVEMALQRMREAKFVGMEYFGSRDEATREASVAEVEHSHIYVGIFGERYGSGTTEAEYRRARERGLPCFIYFKAPAAIAQHDREPDPAKSRLLTELKQRLREHHTVAEFAHPEALAALVTDRLYRWIIDERLTTPSDQAFRITTLTTSVDSDEHRALGVLRRRVEQFWIHGVLEQSLHDAAEIQLSTEMAPVAVQHPWESVLELPGQAGRSLAFPQQVSDTFDEAGRSLLILGGPGAGKTVTLLELARDLSTKAAHDPLQPVPVVFNLSSWTHDNARMADWLIDELQSKYFVPRRIGQAWLDKNLLILLLDSLDEVRPDRRAACIEAINTFVIEFGVPGIAVCSRTDEYVSLPVRLKLLGAVRLQPLSPQQIDEYLVKSGVTLAGLRIAIQEDAALRELAASPLMLSIMTVVYRGRPPEFDPGHTRQQQLFAAYIERMFERRGQANPRYRPDQIQTWLSWLAGKMREHSQTIFLIEHLQPSWLSTSGDRWSYALASRLVGAVALGLTASLGNALLFRPWSLLPESYGPLSQHLAHGLIWSCLLGVLVGAIDGWRFAPLGPRMSTRQQQTLLLGGLAAAGFLAGVGEIFVVLISFLLIFPGRARQRDVNNDVQTVEGLKWSWSGAARAFPRGLLKGAVIGSAAAFVFGFAFEVKTRFVTLKVEGATPAPPVLEMSLLLFVGQILAIAAKFGVVIGITVGPLVGGLVGAIFGGLRRTVVETRTVANQGIALSGRGAILGGLAVGTLSWAALVGLLLAVIGWSVLIRGASLDRNHIEPFLRFIGLISIGAGVLAPISSLWYGGLDVIQHYTLRLVLWWKGYAPRDYAGLLDHAVQLILLRKVGGGYVFVHRLLLEHFAAVDRTPRGHRRDNGEPLPGLAK